MLVERRGLIAKGGEDVVEDDGEPDDRDDVPFCVGVELCESGPGEEEEGLSAGFGAGLRQVDPGLVLLCELENLPEDGFFEVDDLVRVLDQGAIFFAGIFLVAVIVVVVGIIWSRRGGPSLGRVGGGGGGGFACDFLGRSFSRRRFGRRRIWRASLYGSDAETAQQRESRRRVDVVVGG